MSRRRKRTGHANHERWLVSYADFITLLFAFFVVLYASSQVDQRKVGKLAMAIQVAFQEMGIFQSSSTQVPVDMQEPMPFNRVQAIQNLKRNAELGQIAGRPEGSLGGGEGDLADLQRELESALTNEIGRQEISLRREPDGLVLSLREIGFFDSGSAQMKPASLPIFDRIANMLRERKYRLRIEGHTDNVPIHNLQFASNWELSTARATEVIRILIVREGYRAAELSAGGYAEYHPIANNQTAEGRASNRRVDIVILSREEPAGDITASYGSTGHPDAVAMPLPSSYSSNSR